MYIVVFSLYILLCLLYILILRIGWNVLEGNKHTRFILVMRGIGQFNILLLLYFFVENWVYTKAERKLYYYQEESKLTIDDMSLWGVKEEDVRVNDKGEVTNWNYRGINKYKIVFGRSRK